MAEILTPQRLKAARALVGLQQKQLAEMSKVSLSTIARFETQPETARLSGLHEEAIRRALESAGIVLIPDASFTGIVLAVGRKEEGFED